MASQPTVKQGSTGASVKLMQERLNAKGFHVSVDGIFGPGTQVVVEQFQASCNLTADGIVGSTTWGFLMAEGTAPTPDEVLAEARAELLSHIPADANPDVRKVLEAGIAKLGCKEVPNGSNGGPELAEVVEGGGGDGKAPSAYYLYVGIKDKATLQSLPPWCALFVCYCLRKGLGKTSWKDIPVGNWFGGAQQFEDWGKKKGKWTSPLPAHVEPGSIFTISRVGSGSDAGGGAGAGHVGMVVCDNGDEVLTIEGNVSNKVGSHRRKKNAIRGCVIWW